MKYGLIAKKLGHSFSTQLHRMLGGYDYRLMELTEHQLPSFFARRDFAAINVTIPYKETVLPYLDELDPTAASVGAVNTVVNRRGKLIGYNTDLGGMLALIRGLGISLYGKKVLILGTGGTAKTARVAAEQMGAREIRLVSREEKTDTITYSEAAFRHADADILINATPCGMYPDLDGCPVDLTAFPSLSGVVDAVYNPLSTKLVLDARRRGIVAQGGLYMLVMQAALASTLFTGRRVDDTAAERVYRQLLRDKRNLVLIGMPGCGKSSVGRQAAHLLKRDFLDLDLLISERVGKTIPDIFAACGEAFFRDLESGIIREIAGKTGLVIATGGGCVLRQENVTRLRHNGLLMLLDRPLEQISPGVDRPLADTSEKLRLLYHQRVPLYRASADCIVPTEHSVAETAETVVRRFNEVISP